MSGVKALSGNCAAVGQPGTCEAQLQSLYAAYIGLISGQAVVKAQAADFRMMEYSQGNLPALISHYNTLWDSCGGNTTLPRLSAPGANMTQRGGPTRFEC